MSTALTLKCKPLIHFNLFLWYSGRSLSFVLLFLSFFFFAYGYLFIPALMGFFHFAALLHQFYIKVQCVCGSVFVCLSPFCGSICLSCLNYFSFTTSLSTFILFLQVFWLFLILSYVWLLERAYLFLCPMKTSTGIVMRSELILYVNSGRLQVFTLLNISVHNCGVPVGLFRSSLTFLNTICNCPH